MGTILDIKIRCALSYENLDFEGHDNLHYSKYKSETSFPLLKWTQYFLH